MRIGNDKNRAKNPKCGTVSLDKIRKNQKISVSCNLKGKYISVHLPGRDYLQLCEVKAFRCKGGGGGGQIKKGKYNLLRIIAKEFIKGK